METLPGIVSLDAHAKLAALAERIRQAQQRIEEAPSGSAYVHGRQVRDGAASFLQRFRRATANMRLSEPMESELRLVEALNGQLTRALAVSRNDYHSRVSVEFVPVA